MNSINNLKIKKYIPINKKMWVWWIIKELQKDNKKTWKEKWQNWKTRTPEQIKAIALSTMFKKKKNNMINWKDIIKWVKEKLSWAKEAASNILTTKVQNLKTNKNQNKLAKWIMDKNYPSQTVTPNYNKRMDETKALVKQGKAWVARTKLQWLTKQFRKDNPEYKL